MFICWHDDDCTHDSNSRWMCNLHCQQLASRVRSMNRNCKHNGLPRTTRGIHPPNSIHTTYVFYAGDDCLQPSHCLLICNRLIYSASIERQTDICSAVDLNSSWPPNQMYSIIVVPLMGNGGILGHCTLTPYLGRGQPHISSTVIATIINGMHKMRLISTINCSACFDWNAIILIILLWYHRRIEQEKFLVVTTNKITRTRVF